MTCHSLGSGEWLFDDVPDEAFEPVDVVHSPFATHTRYRIGGGEK